MTRRVAQSLCDSRASNCFDKKWANWHDFEKNAAEYFDTSHRVCKIRFTTVEKQNERLSATAIKYSNELKFAYGRVRDRLRLGRPYAIASVCLCIRPAICIEFRYVCTRPAVCIASVFKKPSPNLGFLGFLNKKIMSDLSF